MSAAPPPAESEPVDVLVVGGGIHGAGVLQAAAAAGHSALLLEASALASGTSSRSSKLIHGGLRYLESAQLGLVRESLRERAILLAIAPRLVRLVPFHVPVYRSTRRRPWQLRAGLAMYAALGGLGASARFDTLPRREWEQLDGLDTRGLERVFRYCDGQTDDAALVRAVVASAVELGARTLCPARFLAATRSSAGWQVRCESAGGELELRARVLVNAAGPWAAALQGRITGAPPAPAVDLVSGAHVELSGGLARGIYYVEASDGRAVFAIPWRGHTLVGTTETPYEGDPRAVTALASEVAYLQATFANYFPRRDAALLDSWAGLRVLPRASESAFHRRRDVTWSLNDPARPSYLGIYGGKLTGYRATAAKALEKLAPALPASIRRADTQTLRLPDLARELTG